MRSGPQRRLQALGADKAKTFDTYDEDISTVTPAMLRAYDVKCRGVIVTKNLVVVGPSGVGTTHLYRPLPGMR